MAKFKFTLSQVQLDEVLTEVKKKLQADYDAKVKKAQAEFDAELLFVTNQVKSGTVETKDKTTKPAAGRHTWTEDEIDAVQKMYAANERAAAIGKQLNIPSSAVNAKITAMKKAQKL